LVNEERGKRRNKVMDEDVEQITTCTECYKTYPSVKPACIWCGHKPTPVDRSQPKHVDGDLVLLDIETLRELRGEIIDVEKTVHVPKHLQNSPAEGRIMKVDRERRSAQKQLRYNITLWAGFWRDQGACDSEIYRRFFAAFETDIMSAQALSAGPAIKLAERVDKNLNRAITKNGQ
jgi:hypothetical protein